MWDVVWDSVPTQAEYVCVEYLLTLSHRQLEKKSVKLWENGASETSSPPTIPRRKIIYRRHEAIKIHSIERVFDRPLAQQWAPICPQWVLVLIRTKRILRNPRIIPFPPKKRYDSASGQRSSVQGSDITWTLKQNHSVSLCTLES